MGEPLKGKKQDFNNHNWYQEDDIKSAVEWLKEELKSYKGKVDKCDTETIFIFEKIDQAFPDLIGKNRGNKKNKEDKK